MVSNSPKDTSEPSNPFSARNILAATGGKHHPIALDGPSCLAHTSAGPALAILDWYSHCVHLSVNKVGESGRMLPQENF